MSSGLNTQSKHMYRHGKGSTSKHGGGKGFGEGDTGRMWWDFVILSAHTQPGLKTFESHLLVVSFNLPPPYLIICEFARLGYFICIN